MNTRQLPALITTAVALALAPRLRAQSFYSIDTETDELVRIDLPAGDLTSIGSFDPPLGSGAGVQMTWYRGQLLAIAREGYSNARLLCLDPATGAALSVNPTLFSGQVLGGESLFTLDGELYMSVDPDSDSQSEVAAALALDGTATQVAVFANADLDGLGQDPATGVLYNLDHDGGASPITRLYETTLLPPAQTLLATWPNPGLRAGDPVFIGDRMYAIGYTPARVLEFDLTAGSVGTLLQTYPLSTSHLLRGLATTTPPSSSYCTAAPNSTGFGALIDSTGSQSLAANDFELRVVQGPPNQNGIFFYGPGQQQVAFGNGYLCIAGRGLGLFRLNPPQALDATGTTMRLVDNTNPPGAAGLLTAGSTWSFQFWYRDPAAGGSAFNLSNALAVAFCP